MYINFLQLPPQTVWPSIKDRQTFPNFQYRYMNTLIHSNEYIYIYIYIWWSLYLFISRCICCQNFSGNDCKNLGNMFKNITIVYRVVMAMGFENAVVMKLLKLEMKNFLKCVYD